MVFLEMKSQLKSAEKGSILAKRRHSRARLSALFIMLMFENYERCFFMKF